MVLPGFTYVEGLYLRDNAISMITRDNFVATMAVQVQNSRYDAFVLYTNFDTYMEAYTREGHREFSGIEHDPDVLKRFGGIYPDSHEVTFSELARGLAINDYLPQRRVSNLIATLRLRHSPSMQDIRTRLKENTWKNIEELFSTMQQSFHGSWTPYEKAVYEGPTGMNEEELRQMSPRDIAAKKQQMNEHTSFQAYITRGFADFHLFMHFATEPETLDDIVYPDLGKEVHRKVLHTKFNTIIDRTDYSLIADN